MNTPQSPGHEFWEDVKIVVERELGRCGLKVGKVSERDRGKPVPLRLLAREDQKYMWFASFIGDVVIELYNKAVIENEWEGENIVMLENERELRR